MPDAPELTIRVADFDEVKAVIDTLKAERDAAREQAKALADAAKPFLVGNRCERAGDVDCDDFPEEEPCRVCSLRYALAAFSGA